MTQTPTGPSCILGDVSAHACIYTHTHLVIKLLSVYSHPHQRHTWCPNSCWATPDMHKPQKDQHTDTAASNTDRSQDVRDPHNGQIHTKCTHMKGVRPELKKVPCSSLWPTLPLVWDPIKHLHL